MTSYSEKNGRMIADKLPADFGQKIALKQDPKLAKWAAKQRGKWLWCGVCEANISTANFEDHVAVYHWEPKDANRARSLRR